ncbi:MAG: GtrA family protein [Clostridia bacterium]|nr:GtrA family protein [Clostridia bacterium]
MIQKIKNYLETHQKQYELLRYLIAGGLTTVLSMVVSYGMCFLLADRQPLEGSVILWVIDSINRATGMQVSIANTVSWVIAVLFAFWINRVMVFQVKGGTKASVLTELAQFAGGRIVSFLVFEQGLMLLLKLIGVSNIVNRIFVLVFVMVFNYVISKFWIFKEK